MTKHKIFLGVIVTVCLITLGMPGRSEEGGEAGGARVGPKMAVLAANAKDGMRLSDAAIRRLGLSFLDAKAGEVQVVPHRSLVHFRDESGVYRLRAGWFKLVEIKVLVTSARETRIQIEGLKPGDRIVVAGAPYLRAAELEILGAEKEEDERKD